ncbi:lipoprotein-releasing ABC transporter permease subunit [candidate division TA06 bacterium]|uniref:Lipoprotein-releasing ABC transporter permease subunit n=1 Tax=candidate division TA06 bacterium TaxID=2250710 RepID=A0A933ICT2_UNCT6|nr:lipoprotein-releasing ABC transporter permease subunit [candidate division TA06 bacterium]
MSYELFIAKRYFKAKRRTGFISVMSVLSFAGVTVGVAALLTVLSVMNGAQTELRNKILGTTAHLIILKYQNQPIAEYKELLPKINALSEVIGSSPFIYTKCMVAKGSKVDGLVLRGVDPELEHGVTDVSRNMVAGKLKFDTLSSGLPGIILGLDLADRLGAYLGDTLTVTSSQSMKATPLGLIPKTRRFLLTGIFDTGMYEYNSTLGYIGLAQAQDFLETGPAVTGIEVKIKDIYQAPETGKKITVLLGPQYRYNDWIHLNWSLFSALKLEKTAMFLILALIIIVAALNIISSLIMTVIEKTREIGILKSMGATSKSIMKIFVFQGLLVGGIGTVLGMGLGYALCLLLARYQFVNLPADVYFINKLPVQMQAGDFVLVSVATILITFLAALYPAYKASRLDPIEAIRYE